MTTVNLSGKRVELWDDIETLPVARFHKFNKLLLVDAGVGSDLADFDRHIEKAMAYARGGDPLLAAAELENLRQCVYLVQTRLSPRHMAFAALVRGIDGEPRDDLSEEGLRRVVEELSGVPTRELESGLDSGKKKIDGELRLYFPRLFDDSVAKEYSDMLRRRALLVLRQAAGGAGLEAEIREATDALLTYAPPRSFSGSGSEEIRSDKQFENLCLALSRNFGLRPKELAVLEFYNAVELLEEEAREARSATRRRFNR